MRLASTHTRSFLAALALVAVTGSAALAQQVSTTPDTLAALARKAVTPAEHADVARQYRLQAEAFDAAAVDHEKRAARLAATAPPIAHKWPAMAPSGLKDAKQKALDARRAAHESRLLADRHIARSVEALAE